MLHAPPKDLIQYLSHPNGWWRDNAQQQIVARGDASVAPALAKLATAGESALGRLHALWALEGLGKIDARTIESALSDSDPRVRMAAMRLADPLVADPRSELVSTILKLANDPQQQVRLQFLFTASAIPTTQAEHAVAAMLTRDAQHPYVREAAFSGLAGRELEMLQRLMADPAWQDESPGRGPILGGLASCVIREGNPQRVSRMLDLTAAQSGTLQWRQTALVSGMTTVAGRRVRGPEPVQLAAEPELLASLRHSTDPKLVASGTALAKLLDWPGKPKEQQAKIVPLTPDQQASFERGSVVFGTLCAACHQFDGRGLAGKAPSLVGSEWLLGPKGRPIRVVLHGLRGPVTVNGETTNMEMPPLGILKDEQIADVLTYLRREWGHAASPVALAEVTQIRTQTASRSQPWTEPELKALNLGPTTYPSATEK
jgi:mono/diheme cytochrome c family protein